MKRSELKESLPIDEQALNEHLMQQAHLYQEAGEAVADADAALRTAELELEELIARTDKDVRETAAIANTKITESAVKAEIATDPHVMAQSRRVLNLEHEAKLWRATERAFSQRADMLKKLVDLHLRTTFGYSLESGVSQKRGDLVGQQAEKNRSDAAALRRKRLED